jgi:UDP-N-acetylglucosamine 1-carboxyvinyltransferase
MDKFVIRGGNPLVGTIRISGAKNSALPCMAAAILTEDEVTLENIPQVRDIETQRRLLVSMGAEVELGYGRAKSRTKISCRTLSDPVAKYEIVKTMRASSLVLGPLVARAGMARVAMPGGCAIGGRPIDLHIKGLEKMGASITQEHGYLEARADRLRGAHLVFDKITVTGTEDLLMAAVLAEGESLMENCAREPEVIDLAALLTAMGAKIEGAGASTIRVQGVHRLHGARYRIHPDRIEAGTFLIAGAITGGDLLVANCNPAHLSAVIAKLEEAGAHVDILGTDTVRVRAGGPLRAADISTEELGHGKHLREPLHARAGTGADGRQHQGGRKHGHRARAGKVVCGGRYVLGPAGLGVPGAGRAGGRRRIHPGPRVSHGSRL